MGRNMFPELGVCMNIQKFTQKSMQAVEGCERLAYDTPATASNAFCTLPVQFPHIIPSIVIIFVIVLSSLSCFVISLFWP